MRLLMGWRAAGGANVARGAVYKPLLPLPCASFPAASLLRHSQHQVAATLPGGQDPLTSLRADAPLRPSRRFQSSAGGSGKPSSSRVVTSAATVSSESPAATLYDLPDLYDKVFGFRDYAQETAFIEEVRGDEEGTAAAGGGPKTLLDLGCGTGRHCIAMAAKGYSVTGLDASGPMLGYAERLLASAEASTSQGLDGAVHFSQQDMTAFALDRRDFHVVTMLLGTLSHLHSNRGVLSCFSCVRDHLADDGVFILELAHPAQLFSLPLELGAEAWDVSMADADVEDIFVQYGLESDVFDPVTQLLTRTVVVDHPAKVRRANQKKPAAKGNKKVLLDELPLEEEVVQRFFTCQEIHLLAELSGLKVAKLFGDMDKACAMGTEEDEEYRMVAVLKKSASKSD